MERVTARIVELIRTTQVGTKFIPLVNAIKTKEELKSVLTLIVGEISGDIKDKTVVQPEDAGEENEWRGESLNEDDLLPKTVESFYDLTRNYIQYANDFEKGKGRAVEEIYLDDYPELLMDEKKSMGVDIARTGNAKTVIVCVHGGHVVDIQSFTKQDTGVTALKVMTAIREFQPDECLLDFTGGWGAGVYDKLVEMGADELCILTPITFNEVPRDGKWGALNQRAEMYLILQEKLNKGIITLPPHQELLEELTFQRFEFTNSGGQEKIKIIEKRRIEKERGRSPDYSDALALACYSSNPLEIYT
jgi:hypothetical protein